MSCEEEGQELERAKAELEKARAAYHEAEEALEKAKDRVAFVKEDDEATSQDVKDADEGLEEAEDALEEAREALKQADEAVSEAEARLKECLDRSRQGRGCSLPPPACLSSLGIRGCSTVGGLGAVALLVGGILILLQPPPREQAPLPPPLYVDPITSTFDYDTATTTYKVTATSAKGSPLTYTWEKDKQRECGKFGGNGPTAAWTHPDKDRKPPGDCPSETHHPGLITVVVSDGSASCKAEFPYGSDASTGLTPRCPAGRAGSTPARSWWQLDLWGLDPRWEPWVFIGGGGLVALWAGAILVIGRDPEWWWEELRKFFRFRRNMPNL